LLKYNWQIFVLFDLFWTILGILGKKGKYDKDTVLFGHSREGLL